jgi:hypothetical protein
MDDLEADWNEARKKKCPYNTSTHSLCSFDPIFKTLQEMNLKISFLPIQIMESFLTTSPKMKMKFTSPNHEVLTRLLS